MKTELCVVRTEVLTVFRFGEMVFRKMKFDKPAVQGVFRQPE